MNITISIHHYFHNESKDALLSSIDNKLTSLIERIGTPEELAKLATDLRAGNDALSEAIEKEKGNIA